MMSKEFYSQFCCVFILFIFFYIHYFLAYNWQIELAVNFTPGVGETKKSKLGFVKREQQKVLLPKLTQLAHTVLKYIEKYVCCS